MRLLIAATTLLATIALPAAAANPQADNITGVWQTKSGGYVQVYRKNQVFVGRIVGSTDGKARYDKKNPNPKERGRRLLGVTVLRGLKYQGGNEYGGGKIYDPKSGKTYSAKATVKGPNAVDVRGYIGFSLLGKTQTWHRIAANTQYVRQRLLHHPAGAAPQSGS